MNNLQFDILAIAILPFVFAVTVHEIAHGWVAKKLGDTTAMESGRITLNPIKHVDPIGTLLVPVIIYLWVMFVFGVALVFGWAKPVPITWEKLKRPKRDVSLIAIAGPLANLLMAIFWAIFMKIGVLVTSFSAGIGFPMIYMGEAGILINLIFLILNLFPIPPLDGGRIIASLFPEHLTEKFNKVAVLGLIILVILMLTGVLGKILIPIVWIMTLALESVFGLDPLLTDLLFKLFGRTS